MKKFLKYTALVLFLWIGWQMVYKTGEQKDMDQAVKSRVSVNEFTDGFENINTVKSLFKEDWSLWHEIIVQNNEPKLRRPIMYCLINWYDCEDALAGTNQISIEEDKRFSGSQSLKFTAEPFAKSWYGNSIIALRRQLFEFKKGDVIHFSAWFYFDEPNPNPRVESQNLNDLLFMSFRARNESLRMYNEPGPALFFTFRNYLGLKFDKWKPQIAEVHQDILNRIQMPTNQWVKVKMRMTLSDIESDGLVEVWIDNNKVMAQPARTLPRANTVYEILELGISANKNSKNGQTIYVDNVYVSDEEFID